MLRDPALIPLSHQHQHALALCVRIERDLRAGEPDLPKWRQEIARLYEGEISYHFEGEEKIIFSVAAWHRSLAPLAAELIAEHKRLRRYFQEAVHGRLTQGELADFADALAAHVHKEERQLFEAMQKVLSREELQRMGRALVDYFSNSGMPGASCDLKRK